MQWLWVCWELLVNVVEITILVYFLYNKLGCDPNKRRWMYAFALFELAVVSALNFSGAPSRLTMPVVYIIHLLGAVLVFSGSMGKRIFWGSSVIIVVVFVNFVTVQFASMLPIISINEAYTFSSIRIVMTLFYLSLEVACFFLLARTKSEDIELPRSVSTVLAILMFMTVVAVGLLTHMVVLLKGNITEQTIAVVTVVVMSCLLISLFITIDRAGKYMQRIIRINSELELSRLDKEHVQSIISTVDVMREWRHDLHNHMDLLGYFLANQKYDEMKTYIEEMNGSINEYAQFINSGNTTVDAMVSSKQFVARNADISFSFSCVMPAEGLPIDNIDLCVILGNLLDNALDASKKVDKDRRSIEVTMSRHGGMFHIQVKNSSPGDYSYDQKGQLITNKKGAEHGIGLGHVRRIVDNAGGFLTIEAKSSEFCVDIMIPLNNM